MSVSANNSKWVTFAWIFTGQAYRAAASSANDTPLNVARICAWTWMCAPPPLGPDIHANKDGYAVIAHTFVAEIST